MNKKIFSGVVVSKSGERTVAVVVTTARMHRVYGKAMPQTKKYLVDDPEGKVEIGDKVRFIETRPLSARKRWRLLKMESK
jgi:small subunit ribosomal protein S17